MVPQGGARRSGLSDGKSRLVVVAAVWYSRRITIRSSRTRSEEHTSELQSLMRISYAVFCLKKQTQTNQHKYIQNETLQKINTQNTQITIILSAIKKPHRNKL